MVPAVLAGTPEGATVLATTREGLQRSTDGGKTWEMNNTAPIVQFVAFANATEVIGVEPDGAVHYSPDAGTTWTRTGHIEGQIQATTARNRRGRQAMDLGRDHRRTCCVHRRRSHLPAR